MDEMNRNRVRNDEFMQNEEQNPLQRDLDSITRNKIDPLFMENQKEKKTHGFLIVGEAPEQEVEENTLKINKLLDHAADLHLTPIQKKDLEIRRNRNLNFGLVYDRSKADESKEMDVVRNDIRAYEKLLFQTPKTEEERQRMFKEARAHCQKMMDDCDAYLNRDRGWSRFWKQARNEHVLAAKERFRKDYNTFTILLGAHDEMKKAFHADDRLIDLMNGEAIKERMTLNTLEQVQKQAEEQKLFQDQQQYLKQHQADWANELKSFNNAENEAAQKKTGYELLKKMADVLLKSKEFGPGLAKKYAGDDIEGIAFSYQMAIAEQGTQKDQELLYDFNAEEIRRVQQETVQNKVIRDVVRPLLPGFLEMSLVLRDLIKEKVDRSISHEEKNRKEIEKSFPKGFPVQDYEDPKVREKFRAQVKEKMGRGMKLSDAVEEVLKDRRQALREYVENETRKNSLVPVMSDKEIAAMNKEGKLYSGISEEQWKKSGGATYRKIMTTAEAEKLVAKSNGFLCAVKVKVAPGEDPLPGVREIRPSLPETAVINGENVPLRKIYNLLVKTYITMATNPDGSLKEDTTELVEKFENLVRFMPQEQGNKDAIAEGKRILEHTFLPVMQELLEAQYEKEGNMEAKENAADEVEGICRGLMTVLTNMKTFFMGQEVSLKPKADSVKILLNTDMAKLSAHLETIKLKIWETDEEGKEKLVERVPTKEEIEKAIDATFHDLELANQAMKQVRDLDPNAPDIPIQNACSANGIFYSSMRILLYGGEKQEARYLSKDYVVQRPEDVRRYLLKNFDLLAPGADAQPAELVRYRKQLEEISFQKGQTFQSGMENEDIKTLCKAANAFAKYVYHVAADIVNNEEDGLVTIEGFAAETGQYLVEPFTMHGAIGQYRGETHEEVSHDVNTIKNTGFNTYYNSDNPFASNIIDTLKIYIKAELQTSPEKYQNKRRNGSHQ